MRPLAFLISQLRWKDAIFHQTTLGEFLEGRFSKRF